MLNIGALTQSIVESFMTHPSSPTSLGAAVREAPKSTKKKMCDSGGIAIVTYAKQSHGFYRFAQTHPLALDIPHVEGVGSATSTDVSYVLSKLMGISRLHLFHTDNIG